MMCDMAVKYHIPGLLALNITSQVSPVATKIVFLNILLLTIELPSDFSIKN